MEQNSCGGRWSRRYTVSVTRQYGSIQVDFGLHDSDQRGGDVWLEPEVASRLAHALLGAVASDQNDKVLIRFDVDEQKAA